MIIHKLLAQYIRHQDDPSFYCFQADDAIDWMEQKGVVLGPKTRALDLGCGHGIFGSQLMKRGCQVAFSDEENGLLPELASAPFRGLNIDREDLAGLGEYDLVICSN